jgi:hypothetical protein
LITFSNADFYHFDLSNATQFNTAKTGARRPWHSPAYYQSGSFRPADELFGWF